MSSDPSRAAVPGGGFEADSRRDALAALSQGLGAREPFVLVTGEAGVGKTWIVRRVLEHWGGRVKTAWASGRGAGASALLGQIARGFGVELGAQASVTQLRDRLERMIAEVEAADLVPVIVVDDAADAPVVALHELQALALAAEAAHRPLEVLLVGGPELEARLADPALAALRQRIAKRCAVLPFTQSETRRYLAELASALGSPGAFFSRKASREIFRRSGGVPARIDELAAVALGQGGGRSLEANVHGSLPATAPSPPRTPEVMPPAAPPSRTPSVTAPAPPPARTQAAMPPAPPPARIPDVKPPERAVPASSTPEPGQRPQPRPQPRPQSAPSTEHSAPRSVPAPAAPSAEGPADPRVHDWITRFIRDDEPRFGDLLRAPVPRTFEDSWDDPDGAATIAAGDPASARRGWSAQPAFSSINRTRRRRGRDAASRALPVLAVMLGLMTASTLFLLVRDRHPKAPPANLPARAETPAVRARAPVAATAPIVTPPVVVVAKPPAERWALDVGEYPDREQAEAERDRIVADFQGKAWLVEHAQDSTSTVHLLLGTFSSRERADAAAARLVETGLVSQATVLQLRRRSPR